MVESGLQSGGHGEAKQSQSHKATSPLKNRRPSFHMEKMTVCFYRYNISLKQGKTSRQEDFKKYGSKGSISKHMSL